MAPNLVVDGPNVVQGAVHSISRSPSTDDGSCYPTSVKEHYCQDKSSGLEDKYHLNAMALIQVHREQH